ncbi:bifunctional oligoribonuclease/PAP phosphatase NrnA [Thermodesulfobacteriota bacterium]
MQKGDIQKFADFIKTKQKIIILLHNNPDPDAIGSALGMKALFRTISKSKVKIVFGGIIGRAENRELIRRLKVRMTNINDIDLKRHHNIVMVDTQPNIGNNSLPKGIWPKVIIDHHPLKKIALKSVCCDVRVDYGSTSSIVLEYLKEFDVKIDKKLATALYYGIQTDTDDLGRDRSKNDADAMTFLYPLISHVTLSNIRHPRIPKDYYVHFHEAVNNACVYNDVLISDLKNKCTPEMIAEMSDFFLRMMGIRWVLCFGTHGEGLYFSLRTTARSLRAGTAAIRIAKGVGLAGGHHKSAGGRIGINDKSDEEIEEIKELIQVRFLKAIKRATVKCKKVIKEEVEDEKV